MILLYGKSPSGKTEYFKSLHTAYKIIHASDINELRNKIVGTESVFEENRPTLINTWFDLDCKHLLPYLHYDVYIEAHYFETERGLKIVDKGIKHYYGLYNENLISNRKMFIRKTTNETKTDWIKVLGTRYHALQSAFPEIIE